MSAPDPPFARLEVLREWFDVTTDAMIAVDAQGVIVALNAHAGQMFGREHAALIGQPIESLVPDSLRAAHRRHRERYMAAPAAGMVTTGRELVGVRSDRARIPLSISLLPVMTEHGLRVLASVRDISNTWRARELDERTRRDALVMEIGRLATSSPDYKLIVRQAPETVARALGVPAAIVFATDLQHAAPYIRASTGVTATAGQTLISAFWSTRFIRTVFASGRPRAFTTEQLDDAQYAHIRQGLAAAGFRGMALVPLPGRTEPLGAIAALAAAPATFSRDKIDFLQSVANLLAAAVQRSQSEEQLAHAYRLDAIGQLTGGIAHDFNNLLTVVSGNLQLLEAELSDRPDVRESIDSALRAVDRGSSLTHQLLAFARRQPLQPRAVVPKPLMDELAHMLRRTLGETIVVEVECAADVADVYADPNELDTALVNLALNARDAMPRGGRLTITARNVEASGADTRWDVPAGRYVAFEIADTGIGMSADAMAHAFEPFFTTKEPGRGSGLGLSMVYGFVTQSGGAVTVDSQLGYGTRITFLLPVARARERRAGDAPPTVRVAAPAHATVLVVEDEQDVRAVAVRFLQAIGYTVLSASDANGALATLTTHPKVDLLFSDVVLGGGMDGAELARVARQSRPHLAVLLTSGYEGRRASPDRASASAETFELLHKPYSREALINAIHRLLSPG